MTHFHNHHKHEGSTLLIEGRSLMGVTVQKFCYYLDISNQSYFDKIRPKDSKSRKTSVSTKLLEKLQTLVKTFYPQTPEEKKKKKSILRKLDDEINIRKR